MRNVEIMKVQAGIIAYKEQLGAHTLIVYKINFAAEYEWVLMPTDAIAGMAQPNIMALAAITSGYTYKTDLGDALNTARAGVLAHLCASAFLLIQRHPQITNH